MLDLWLDYMERGIFDGGCFFAAATIEMDGRPGPVRDAIAEQMRAVGRPPRRLARDGDEPAASCSSPTPTRSSSRSSSTRSGSAVNSGWQLHEDDVVFERGHRAIRRRLEADATERGRAALAAPAADAGTHEGPAVSGALANPVIDHRCTACPRTKVSCLGGYDTPGHLDRPPAHGRRRVATAGGSQAPRGQVGDPPDRAGY